MNIKVDLLLSKTATRTEIIKQRELFISLSDMIDTTEYFSNKAYLTIYRKYQEYGFADLELTGEEITWVMSDDFLEEKYRTAKSFIEANGLRTHSLYL